ncbi:MAG: ADP-heptose:LPS heptosyltransferase [Planctomycetota bacterium]
MADALKLGWPDVQVGWAVHPLSAPLIKGHPCVDRVHIWPRAAGMAMLKAGRQLVRELRAERYDLVIDLSRIAKSALVARACGAPRVLGYDRGRAKEGSWLLYNERVPAGHRRTPMLEQVLEFARYLGLPAERARRRLPLDPGAESWAEEQLKQLGGAPILVHIGASKPPNRWPSKRHGELARLLAAAKVGPVCLTGGPDELAAGAEAAAVAGPNVHVMVGASSLLGFASLAARAQLFVGCDTGPMHLAAAAGCPVVALFGPADPLRTGPFGPEHVVAREPSAGSDRDKPLPAASMLALEPDSLAAFCLERLSAIASNEDNP